MANVDKAYGFRLFKTSGKQPIATKYVKTAGAAIYPGDAVKVVAAGTVSKYADGDGVGVLGVAAEYAASASDEVWVYDDPDYIFECQITTFAAADVGLNTDIGADSPDADLRYSGNELDAGANDVTATLPFKILGLSPKPGNEVGANADVLVKINQHVLGGGTGATGI